MAQAGVTAASKNALSGADLMLHFMSEQPSNITVARKLAPVQTAPVPVAKREPSEGANFSIPVPQHFQVRQRVQNISQQQLQELQKQLQHNARQQLQQHRQHRDQVFALPLGAIPPLQNHFRNQGYHCAVDQHYQYLLHQKLQLQRALQLTQEAGLLRGQGIGSNKVILTLVSRNCGPVFPVNAWNVVHSFC